MTSMNLRMICRYSRSYLLVFCMDLFIWAEPNISNRLTFFFGGIFQVRGLPTLYFISPDPNKDAIRTEGLVPAEMIKNIIDNEL